MARTTKIAYRPSRSGRTQMHWNFDPKSIYRSSLTVWTILPETILPLGSPNCKLSRETEMELIHECCSEVNRTHVDEFGLSQQFREW